MNRKLISKAIGAVALSAFLLVGCGENSDDPNEGGDGGGGDNSYTYSGPIKTIGGKKWMGENLNRAIGDSKCYGEDGSVSSGGDMKTLSAKEIQDNCARYGRLYKWEDAKTACPSGWHLPTDAEWTALRDSVGGVLVAGGKLKATSGWDRNGNGTDDFGFSALPGGWGISLVNGFAWVGEYGHWWSATESEYSAYSALCLDLSYDSKSASLTDRDKSYALSVRCVQN